MTDNPPPQRTGWFGRNWLWFVPLGCFGILLCGGLLVVVIGFGVFKLLKSSTPYQLAVARAKADPQVIAALGTPIEEGLIPTGNINVNNNNGNANLQIPISGPKGGASIHVVATEQASTWTIQDIEITVDGAAQPIKLSPAAPDAPAEQPPNEPDNAR